MTLLPARPLAILPACACAIVLLTSLLTSSSALAVQAETAPVAEPIAATEETTALTATETSASETAKPVAGACPGPVLAPSFRPQPDRSGAPIEIYAERMEADKVDTNRLSGRVELFRADQYLATEIIEYEPLDRRVRVPGPLIYTDAQVRFSASGALVGLNEDSGNFDDVTFGIVGSTAHGAADNVHFLNGSTSLLRNAWVTTCPGDEPDWRLSAGELELRHAEGDAVARKAKLELLDIPVLYLPWITFPIDDRRKTGFLYPFISTANDNGLEMGIPFYWNIAPQTDATFTPRYFTDRGFMLDTEYRLLTRRSGSQLDVTYLPDDKNTREDRWNLLFRSSLILSPRWQGDAHLERTSDNEYFQDFGGSLAQTSRQYLRSNAGLGGHGRYWDLDILVDEFQVLDDSVRPENEPYSRLPRVAFTLDTPLGRNGLQAELNSEAVNFYRDLGVTGARMDLYPNLAWVQLPRWGFFEAAAGYRYTTYDLDLKGGLGEEQPDRGLPILSLDSGLMLERELKSGNTQTLEPRVYYLYVPYEDQDALPDFDTGDLTFGYAQLFHYNRFTGADRQSDANQITLAASTRSFGARDGREHWAIGAGQIIYLESPQVTLDPDEMEELDTSPFIGELSWSPTDRFNARIGTQWNWEQQQMDVGVIALDHSLENGQRLGAEYRYRRDRLDQMDVRYLWPLNEAWRVYTRVNYSFADADLLEALAGVEYESCCWAVRMVARQYLKDRNGGERNALYLEMRLKGLGSFGRQAPPLFYTPASP